MYTYEIFFIPVFFNRFFPFQTQAWPEASPYEERRQHPAQRGQQQRRGQQPRRHLQPEHQREAEAQTAEADLVRGQIRLAEAFPEEREDVEEESIPEQHDLK